MKTWMTPDPVARHAIGRPDAPAAVDLASGRQWTYAQLDASIQQAITALRAEGVEAGDRVAVVAHNSVDQIVLQQALMRLGGLFVPINWRLSAAEQADILADCTPCLLLTDASPPQIPQVPEDCATQNIDAWAARVEDARPAPRLPPTPAETPCVLLYTSGTSGRPKGVLLTPQTLFFTGVNFGHLGEVDTGCVFLCDAPMFHVIGIVTSVWPPLLRGGAILVSSGFDAITTNARLADPTFGVTHYFCVPQMAQALRHADNFQPAAWSNLKALFTGGAPNPRTHILWWLDQGVLVVDGFGMTEAGTILGMPLSMKTVAAKAGSVGIAGPATEVRLVDVAGQEIVDDTPGEIEVFGLNVTPGYWNRPDATAQAFTDDGWLRTGDIGRRDADGFIFIVDRAKDMFISGGENVYPTEVEAALLDHPEVREAAVIGIPDDRWGEVGRAYVVRAEAASIDAATLADHCSARIARFKVPKEFLFVDSLPRTGSGKLQKQVLRQRARLDSGRL